MKVILILTILLLLPGCNDVITSRSISTSIDLCAPNRGIKYLVVRGSRLEPNVYCNNGALFDHTILEQLNK